jgi:putative ABC transport system ATP-binding protein
VLLADEPTGNLDSKTGTEIMALILDVNRTGVTIIMVTHDPRMVQYTTRAIRMRDGRVERDEENATVLDAREVPLK